MLIITSQTANFVECWDIKHLENRTWLFYRIKKAVSQIVSLIKLTWRENRPVLCIVVHLVGYGAICLVEDSRKIYIWCETAISNGSLSRLFNQHGNYFDWGKHLKRDAFGLFLECFIKLGFSKLFYTFYI